MSRAFCAHCVHHFPFFSSPLSPRPAETETMDHWQPLSPLSFLQQAQLSQEARADPSLFPPRSPDSSPRAERRCKNKQDVWISAHKRSRRTRRELPCSVCILASSPVHGFVSSREGVRWDLGYWKAYDGETGGQSPREEANYPPPPVYSSLPLTLISW